MDDLSNQLLAAAVGYAEMGYLVFPCIPGGKTPLTPRGFHDATTDAEQIEGWWREHPGSNIGLATNGLVVLDLDNAASPWLTAERELDLVSGIVAETPRGGRHCFFRPPAGRTYRCSAGRLGDGIDVRADGGYVVVAPSVNGNGRGYRWIEAHEIDGPPSSLPELPAWLADELEAQDATEPASPAPNEDAIIEGKRNSTLASIAGRLRRQGHTADEIASLLHRVNANRCRPPLADREVEQVATSVARYEPDAVATALAFDQYNAVVVPERPTATLTDPGPIPPELLRVPGFVSEVIDHCLDTAPYPNPAMAFCGALALQGFLAGRKVRDPGDNRTNLYLLALAHSASGKDWPRKLNTRLLNEIGLADCLGDRFASGEGLQDAMLVTPAMLFQTDEIDGMLQAVNKAKDGRYENLMGTMLTMYSAANTCFPLRRKAGQEKSAAINQPCLVVLGSAIPNHYYGALSLRMLTNGFFARQIVVESGPRGSGREPRIVALPTRIIETARWWRDFLPGGGNLAVENPVPLTIDHTAEAARLVVEARLIAEHEYNQAEARQDMVGTTVWGRVSEQVRKLSLIHAISTCHTAPRIDAEAVRWATTFVMHQVRRMLFMAHSHVAESDFDAECLKLIEKLRASPNGLAHSVLLKRMKNDSRRFAEIIDTLLQRGDIVVVNVTTGGRPFRGYRLAGEPTLFSALDEAKSAGVKEGGER